MKLLGKRFPVLLQGDTGRGIALLYTALRHAIKNAQCDAGFIKLLLLHLAQHGAIGVFHHHQIVGGRPRGRCHRLDGIGLCV